MKIGEVFRYSDNVDPTIEVLDGLPNFYHATRDPQGRVTLERGINSPRKTKAIDGERRSVVLIRSSPGKVGSETTPWHDLFDPDYGHIRYFGDNKVDTGKRPAEMPGNQLLLDEVQFHQSIDKGLRQRATPLVFFLGVPHGKRPKGFVKFQGFGVIERAELVTQWDPQTGRSFPNYRFDFVVLGLAHENEEFPWAWIVKRRDPSIALAETYPYAPQSWRQWVRAGRSVLGVVRRNVARLRITPHTQQRPQSPKERNLLEQIYQFYNNKKHRFEALAEVVAERVIGTGYRRGWITPPHGDGGADFVGRLDVGEGFCRAKLVVLGQAKCEQLHVATGGNHIARTVARLKRGWLGVYVTTSYFSQRVQQEVLEDQYPIILIHGRHIAETASQLMNEQGEADVGQFLETLDANYIARVQHRRPEEILLD